MFRYSSVAKSLVRGPIQPNFKFIQSFIEDLITCKYELGLLRNIHECVEISNLGIWFDGRVEVNMHVHVPEEREKFFE